MRPQHLIPSPNMLSSMHVYYQGDFLTEAEASQFMHNSLLSQVNQHRNAAASLSNAAFTKASIKRPVSAKPLGSSRNHHKEMGGADQDTLDTDAMVDDLKFIRASLMDKGGKLLLKDGVNDTSSTAYRELEQLVRKRPLSAGTCLDSTMGRYTIRDMQMLRSNNLHELLPEAQRDLLGSNMRVDFSLFTNEKAQKELNESINFINKGINLEASNHGMAEDVLSTYRRKRPASAHCITTQGLLSPHSASFSNQHSKTTSRPASMRRRTITRVQDLQDRLNDFTTNETQSRCCFGDTYNSITQGHHPITINSELPMDIDMDIYVDVDQQPFRDIASIPEAERDKNIDEAEYRSAADHPLLQYDTVHTDAADIFVDHRHDQPHVANTHNPKPDGELNDSLVCSGIPPILLSTSEQAQCQVSGPCGNVTAGHKRDSAVESSQSHTKSDRFASTTDELSVDSEGNIYAIIGKERKSSRRSTEICINRQRLSAPDLADDAVPNHGEVILDEEIFETICSQHSTQSSTIESSLNASLTKIAASRNVSKSRFYQKSRTKNQGQEKRDTTATTTDAATTESNFRQILHSDKKFPTSFQPKTTHVAASHSTLDISEGPIEVRRVWRPPHSVGRPISTPQIDHFNTVREHAKSTPDVCRSEHIDTSIDSANSTSKLDRRVIVPERQGFKGSIITSYQRAIANRTRELNEKEVKAASIAEHIVDLKKVYGGFNIDKSSFSMEGSAPLMTVKATIPYVAVENHQKQMVDHGLEGSSEAIAPAEQSAGDFRGMESGFKGVSHSTPPQCSQIDAYPMHGSVEYSGKKEDMEDVVDLPEESSNIQSISCLINSQLQRSDLEASLVIPRMDIARHLEHSADLLGSIAEEISMCSDEVSQRGRIVLRRGSGQKEDSARRPSSTDQTSKDPSLYERIHDFRETVKQELSQQASLSALASKRRSSLTIPADPEDLPPQTFINTTVIPLQKRLDEAIAAAMSKKPKLPADESDTLANYIEIDDGDDKTDDRAATPTIDTMDALCVQQETPRPGDLNAAAEHILYPEEQYTTTPEHMTDSNVTEGEVEHFAVSRSDTQKPCVDINHIESPGYPMDLGQTGIHVVDLEAPVVSEANISLYADATVGVHTDHHTCNMDQSLESAAKLVGIKELAHIDQLLRDAKKLNTSLQTSIYKDQPSELPADYEAKMVLDDYELDANFPILEEGECGIDPTGEQDAIIANYRRLAMDAAQKRGQRFDIYPNTSGREYSTGKVSQAERDIECGSDEDRTSGVRWADMVSGDHEYQPKYEEPKHIERVGSANWRMFAGQGSSSANMAQTHKRGSSSTSLSAALTSSQPAQYESQYRRPYNKFEKYTPRQFLSSASLSQTFKPEQDTGNLGLSVPNQSIVTDTTTAGPCSINDSSTATLHNTLPIQLETVKDQFNHVANCAKSLLMTQDLDKSGALDQLDTVQTPEKSSIDNPNAQFYTSFSGTPSRIDHMSMSRGEPVQQESAVSPGSKRARASTLGTSSVRSVTSNAANRPTRIKSAVISKLVKEITSVNNTTVTNLARSGYNKARLESSRENMLPRSTAKCNEKLERAASLLEKPRHKTGRVSAAQSDLLSESISRCTARHDSYSVSDDASELKTARPRKVSKGSAFISTGLGSTGTLNQQSKLLSSRAIYEAQTVRIGGSAKIKTRVIHPERPVALKTDNEAALSLHVTPVTTLQPSALLPKRPDSSGSRPGKLMKVADARIGRQSQALLSSSSSIDARPYYGSSALFRSVDDMIVVTPSPATRNMVISMKNRGSVDSAGRSIRDSKITRPASDRQGRQSVTSSIITSPAASKSLLSRRPRSAIASSTCESIVKHASGAVASDMDDSGMSLIVQTADAGLEPISLMAKPLAVQSPERILKDPYDVHGTLRDEADRYITCRGFRVSSAGKLRLPSTIEKDLVVNIRPLTAKASAVMGM